MAVMEVSRPGLVSVSDDVAETPSLMHGYFISLIAEGHNFQDDFVNLKYLCITSYCVDLYSQIQSPFKILKFNFKYLEK